MTESIDWTRRVVPVADLGGERLEDLVGRRSDPRRWGRDEPPTLSDYDDQPIYALIGPPGSGKSVELSRRALALEAARPGTTHQIDLGLLSESQILGAFASVQARLDALPEDEPFHVFLDGLDEARIHLSTVAGVLLQGIESLPVDRVRIRFACRPLEWPKAQLESRLSELFDVPSDRIRLQLLPLSDEDARRAFTERVEHGDPRRFFDRVLSRANVAGLARHPITLLMLLDLWAAEGDLPDRITDLYERAARGWFRIRDDRRHELLQGHGDIGDALRQDIGRVLAATSLLTGIRSIWSRRTASTGPDDIVADEFAARATLPRRTGPRAVELAEVQQTLRHGPFDGDSEGPYRWSHRTLAEYLAAQALDRARERDGVSDELLNERLIRLLTEPDAHRAGRHVVPQLTQIAAWLATLRPTLFDRLVEESPEALLRADLSLVSSQRLEVLVAKLLDKVATSGLADTWEWAAYVRDLRRDDLDLAPVLTPYLVDAEGSLFARRLAVEIAGACSVSGVSPLLERIIEEPPQGNLRDAATRAWSRTLPEGERVPKMKRLLERTLGEEGRAFDPVGESRGLALRVLWPDHLTLEELKEALEPETSERFVGRYFMFCHYELAPHLDAPAIVDMLSWLLERPPHRFRDMRDPAAGPLLVRAAELSAAPSVADKLVEVVLHESSIADFIGLHDVRKVVRQDRSLDEALTDAVLRALERDEFADWALEKLGLESDVHHLLARLTGASPERQRAIAKVCRRRADLRDLETTRALLEATASHPTFGETWQPVWDRLGAAPSTIRDAVSAQKSNLRPERELPDPPIATLLEDARRRLAGGDLSGLVDWIHYASFDDEGFRQHSLWQTDPWEFTWWVSLADAPEARQQLLMGCQAWLEQTRLPDLGWVGTDQLPGRAGVARFALYLLEHEAPERLDALSDEAWEHWASVVATVARLWMDDVWVERLLRRATSRAPEALAIHFDAELRLQSHWQPDLRAAEWMWSPAMEKVLKDVAADDDVVAGKRSSALLRLLRQGAEGVSQLVVDKLEEARDDDLDLGARLLADLLKHNSGAIWPLVYERLRGDLALAQRVFEDVAHGQFGDDAVLRNLRDGRQVAQLYEILASVYVPSEDPPEPKGAHAVGRAEAVRFLRDRALHLLQEQSDLVSLEAMSWLLQAQIPGVELTWRLGKMIAAHHEATWKPPTMDQVLAALEGRPYQTVYVSSRFSHPSRGALRDALQDVAAVVVTEGRPRDGALSEVLALDVRSANVVVQILSWSTGMAEEGAPSVVAVEGRMAAHDERLRLLIGVLQDADEAPEDIRDYLAEMAGHTVWFETSDAEELVATMTEEVRGCLDREGG